MPNLGMFRATGAVLRTPGGNVENIADQKQVIQWAALNVGGEVERDPSRWKLQRSLYADARIKTLPWLHCRTLDDAKHQGTLRHAEFGRPVDETNDNARAKQLNEVGDCLEQR